MPSVTITDSVFAFGNGPPSTPVLDDCLRADESNLSDGGKWTHSGSITSFLGLFNHAIYGQGANSQMSFSAAGDLTDAEAYVTLVTVNFSPHFSGVVVRQDPGSSTGANCYALIYTQGTGLQIIRFNGSGVATVLATYSVTAGFHDTIGLRAEGSTLTAWYKPNGGSWSNVLTVTDTTLTHGYIGTRMDGFFQNTVTTFGGGAGGIRDTLRRDHPVAISDTGLSFADGGIVFPVGPDTGLAFGESLFKSAFKPRTLTDAGIVSVSDSLGNISITDTGLTFSVSLARLRVVQRALSDTGVAATDATVKHVTKLVTDRGLFFTDDLVVTKNGHNTSLSFTTVGLATTDSISKSSHLFRAAPGPFSLPDFGCAITDGIRVRGGHRPARPHADFTFAVSGETVTFTDTSTPGSAPIGSWSWHFGDGDTDSVPDPVHTYASVDTYTVTLTVTTIYGSDSVAKPVTTTAAPVTAGTHIDAVLV